MKNILITGGSGKVGFQLVRHFLGNGYKVITTSTNRERFLDKKHSELSGYNLENFKVIEVDFSENSALNLIRTFIQSNKIVLTHVIHNARSLRFLKLENDKTISAENFSGELFMDVVFPYRLSMELINNASHKIENIIFISSMYGVVAPTPSLYDNFEESSAVHYGVSKAAQIHLTKELAVRLAPEIRVNCVSFGGIKGRTDKDFESRYKNLTPQQKMLEEEDVIGPVDFLVSDNSNNMTGQNIKVDGGWTIW
ncbi:SDR family oxidoreductase [Christiangramia forsetii]|uniref:Short-chain dehydrogenase/reductase family protein n=2 Tax=Christiangramia forsetii TaxID=411153 RepID=A0M2Z4_CHRFK|nr:SDR family oxidoreductase [Christiangramia forsetii]GGG27165.1 SDR family oxidoreductase [Christiangramia forsetii]CAL66989.1 short-chain dehydrogenase/reductase family protein [Christiangramia forsetii KT0803]